jgi:hexosaminidase
MPGNVRPRESRRSSQGALLLVPHPRRVDLSDDASVDVPSHLRTFAGGGLGLPAEGYRLSVGQEDGIVLEAADARGLFYGRSTLAQLERLFDGRLPRGVVEDWPDVAVRGVMLDVSRTKVPSLETLFGVVDRLASWKFNHLELYMEHTYAYSGHRRVWEHADPYSSDDLERLRVYCADRHVELVPNQNTLGHMERWLLHEPYSALGIARGAVLGPFGMPMPASTLDPADPASMALVSGLLAELCVAVPAGAIHVGLDEPWQLPSERRAEWSDWLCSLRGLESLDGRELLVWGDLLASYPDQLPRLPEGVTVCEWGYESNHPFEARSEALAGAGASQWLCPGTSSWMSFLGRLSNAVGNCWSAALAVGEGRATGFLVTDWGDFGHHQYLPVSDLALAAAAAFAWCASSNAHLDNPTLGALCDLHCYDDPTRSVGASLALLGDVYLVAPSQIPNMSSLVSHVYLPQLPVGSGLTSGLEPAHLEEVESRLDAATEELARAAPRTEHGKLSSFELSNAVRLVRLACEDARARLASAGTLTSVGASTRRKLAAEIAEITDEHRNLWLRRNRAGGLDESCAWFDHLRRCYESGEPDPAWGGPLVELARSLFPPSA